MSGREPLELVVDDVIATVHPAAGGRLGSLRIGGRPILCSDPVPTPALWGCYPMAPWAGRLRHGTFQFDGRTVRVPLTLAPHAIHGTVHDREWEVVDAGRDHCELRCPLDWPLGGIAHQHVQMHADGITLLLAVMATSTRMPAVIGWHPCFVAPAASVIRFSRMYERDDEGITTDRLGAPSPPPWDDCFVGPLEPIRLSYGGLEVDLGSDCDHWVVYDEIPGILCVEPQSGPPDAVNTGAAVVLEPGEVLQRRFSLTWRRPAPGR